MTRIASIFHSLEGKWDFSGTSAGLGSTAGITTGTATFQRVNSDINFLHYREEGEFTNAANGIINKAYRDYRYRLQGDSIAVFFAEEPTRLLHTLEFDNTSFLSPPIIATDKHPCACDTYDATYQFILPKTFTLTYSVKGLKKDYIIHSIFERHVPKVP